jgi:hypothetical protein
MVTPFNQRSRKRNASQAGESRRWEEWVMFEDFAIAVLAAATAATAWLLPALPARADVTTNHSPSIDCPLDK